MRILSQDGSIDMLYEAASVIEVLPLVRQGEEEPSAWAVSVVISDYSRTLGTFLDRKNAVYTVTGIAEGAAGMSGFVRIPEDPDAKEEPEGERGTGD